jgi:hypothetical protein
VSTPTPPGWYPDPDDPAFLRFFDGTSWTTGRAPADRLPESPPPPDAPPAPPASSGEIPDPGPADTTAEAATSAPADATGDPAVETAEPGPGPAPADTASVPDPEAEATKPAPGETAGETRQPAPHAPDIPEPGPLDPAAAGAADVPQPGPLTATGPLDPTVATDPTTAGIPQPAPLTPTGPLDPTVVGATTAGIPQPGPLDPTVAGAVTGYPSGPPAPGPMPPPPGAYPPPPPLVAGTTSPQTARRGLLIGGGAVLVVLLAIVGFVVLRSDEPDVQWQGEAISEPETTLEEAEGVLDSVVDERHGALGDDSRCYFSLPEDESVKDVNDHVRCGPVLFVDGDAGEPFLSFPLTASDDEGDLRLAVGEQSVEPEPTALESGERLVRPDDQQAPEGSGGLEPPEPPAAADDLLEAVELGPTSTGTPPAGASIGSLNASYDLTQLATIDRYGAGDSARRPADDHQLIAFSVSEGLGEAIVGTGTPTVQVQIDGDTPRDVTDLIEGGDTVAVSAPTDAESVDLVVTDAEVEQRLSLLDGTPAAGNLRVLTRTNRDQEINAAHQVGATGTDGVGSLPVTGTITVNGVHLEWFLPEDATKRAANGNNALLVLSLAYNWVEITPPDAGLSEQAFTLTLPDGQTLPGWNLAPDPVNQAIIVFEVSADFTTGTLNIGGVVPQPAGVTVDFGANVYYTSISIPAG